MDAGAPSARDHDREPRVRGFPSRDPRHGDRLRECGDAVSIKTNLEELSDEQLRAVRDDRMAITDELYKVIDSTLDPLAIRIALFTHLTKSVTNAQDEVIDRIYKQMRDFDERVAASAQEASQ